MNARHCLPIQTSDTPISLASVVRGLDQTRSYRALRVSLVVKGASVDGTRRGRPALSGTVRTIVASGDEDSRLRSAAPGAQERRVVLCRQQFESRACTRLLARMGTPRSHAARDGHRRRRPAAARPIEQVCPDASNRPRRRPRLPVDKLPARPADFAHGARHASTRAETGTPLLRVIADPWSEGRRDSNAWACSDVLRTPWRVAA